MQIITIEADGLEELNALTVKANEQLEELNKTLAAIQNCRLKVSTKINKSAIGGH